VETTSEVLPKGTIVKLDGLPLELLADTPFRGERNKETGAQQKAAPAPQDFTKESDWS